MTDEDSSDVLGCGKPLGTSGHYRVFCGQLGFRLCRECTDRRDASPDAWRCPGCKSSIVEGQHFMEVVLRIDTRLPPDVQLVRELPATEISVKVHGPACLLQYLATDEVVQDVFGR